MEADINTKKNDRLFPKQTDEPVLLLKCSFYGIISFIGGVYLFKHRKMMMEGEKMSMKILVFPIASFLSIVNTSYLIDLLGHKVKYPELYENKD